MFLGFLACKTQRELKPYERVALVHAAGFRYVTHQEPTGTLRVYRSFLKTLKNPEDFWAYFEGLPVETVRDYDDSALWLQDYGWEVVKSERYDSGAIHKAEVWVSYERDTYLVELVETPSGWKAIMPKPY